MMDTKKRPIRTLILTTTLVLSACSFQANEEGWESLFDGESLSGWVGYMGAPIAEAWSVQNGVLTLKGGSPKGNYVNIRTEAEFVNFELVWDWKLEPGSNSGLMFHVKEGPTMPYLTGPEYQLLDNEGFRGGDGKPVAPVEYTATHYAIEEAFEDVMKPIGEWNSSRIMVEGDHVQYWLNGVKTAEYTMHSDEWNQQVAAVKFGKWKLFGTTGEGHIALQDHGHGASFRNIRIKRL